MITGISIENFKGIRERVDIELRPLTLLFGANSAGKSSILHALQYAAEIFERRNLDADFIGDGTVGIDLGGFRNFVHDHNLNRDVTIGLRLGLSATDSFASLETSTPWNIDEPSSLYKMPESCRVTLVIGWSNLFSAPFVRRYTIEAEDVKLAEIRFEPGREECVLLLNESHPILVCSTEHTSLANWYPLEQADLGSEPIVHHLLEWASRTQVLVANEVHEVPWTHGYSLTGLGDAFPDLDRPLPLSGGLEWIFSDIDGVVLLAGLISPEEVTMSSEEIIEVLREALGIQWDNIQSDPRQLYDAVDRLASNPRYQKHHAMFKWLQRALASESSLSKLSAYLRDVLSQLVLGPGRILRNLIVRSRFLGPIRAVPQRNHTPSRKPERSRWSSGLGAWDRLETADSVFIDAVSNWLGNEDRLNSGYRLRLKRFKELDVGNPLVVQLLAGRVFDDMDIDSLLNLNSTPTQSRLLIVPLDESIELRPSDVGIGISQVVPVIVTALDGAARTIVVEQPELHLHPRLQAELADLFIEAAKGRTGHSVLLETHSELIPLRLMRRIRESFEQKEYERLRLTEKDVAVYYVEAFHGATVVTRLNLSEQGQLLDPWPDGFFEEGYRERFAD